jgi:hypothetical protein
LSVEFEPDDEGGLSGGLGNGGVSGPDAEELLGREGGRFSFSGGSPKAAKNFLANSGSHLAVCSTEAVYFCNCVGVPGGLQFLWVSSD